MLIPNSGDLAVAVPALANENAFRVVLFPCCVTAVVSFSDSERSRCELATCATPQFTLKSCAAFLLQSLNRQMPKIRFFLLLFFFHKKFPSPLNWIMF